MDHINSLLSGCQRLSLDDAHKVVFNDRRDQKFIFHPKRLASVIEGLGASYAVLEVEGSLLQSYKNLYFDTGNFRCYLDHHNGKLERYKFRFRHYENTGKSYFEIKLKSNRGRSYKFRKEIREFSDYLPRELYPMIKIHSPIDPDSLKPVLRVHFQRITLIHRSFEERVTLDTRIGIFTPREKNTPVTRFDNLLIAEVKQNQYHAASSFIRLLRSMNIHEMRVSKYCIGALEAYPHLKYNRFKEKQLNIKKISHIDYP